MADGFKDEELEASIVAVVDADGVAVVAVGVLVVVNGAENENPSPCPGTAVELLLELKNGVWDVDADAWAGAAEKSNVDDGVNDAALRGLDSTTRVLFRCCVWSIHRQ